MKVILAFGEIGGFDFENVRLSSQRQEKVDFYRFDDDKKRCALAEVLLRQCLVSLGLEDKDIVYSYNEYGNTI